MLTGQTLFPVNVDNDITSAAVYKDLYNWSPEKKMRKLSHPKIDSVARSLLMKLLSRNPEDRGT